jgi:hypothetical protein
LASQEAELFNSEPISECMALFALEPNEEAELLNIVKKKSSLILN